MSKHTILFLAANPLGTTELALHQEARAIQEELERSGHRDKFELATRWAVQPLDLLSELRKLKPTVVHFSGHGGRGEWRSSAGPNRDLVADLAPTDGRDTDSEHVHELFFQGPDGRPRAVSSKALKETFGAAGSSVKLVVLNACYSEVHAKGLLAHVDYVVGMRGSIGDDAARSFAIGFYGGLGELESVAVAYQQGCAAIRLEGLSEGDQPRLKVRGGVNAHEMIPVDLEEHPARRTPSHAALLAALDGLATNAARGRTGASGHHARSRSIAWLGAGALVLAMAGSVLVLATRRNNGPPHPSAGASEPCEEAKQLSAEQKYAESLAMFQRCFELSPTPQALIGIATELLHLGRCAEAHRSSEELLARWPIRGQATVTQAKARKILEGPSCPVLEPSTERSVHP